MILWAAWRRGTLADRYAQGIFIGLLFSLFADLALIPAGGLAAGLVLLGAAHLAFVSACESDAFSTRSWPLSTLGALLQAAIFATAWAGLSAPLTALVALVGLLGAIALGAFGARARRLGQARGRGAGSAPLAVLGQAALVAAVAFRVLDQALPQALAPLWIQSLHWLGLTLLALSIPWHPQRISDTEGVAGNDDNANAEV
ncbi:MAG: lysoplasmalogenase family protein [Burkholderiaceae bacterium]